MSNPVARAVPRGVPGAGTAARRTVIGLMAFAVVASLLRSFVKGPQGDALRNGGRPRILVGGLVGTVFLLFISDWAPKVATGFAVVVATTAALTAGPETFDVINPANPRPRGPVGATVNTLATYAPGAATAAYDPSGAINSYLAAAAPGAAPVAPATTTGVSGILSRIGTSGGGGQGGGGGGGGSW